MYKISDDEVLFCFQSVEIVDYRPVVRTCLVIENYTNLKAYKMTNIVTLYLQGHCGKA